MLVLMLVVGAGTASAATRLVAKSGANGGNCTVTPCLTIAYALGQSAATGDTISVGAGVYAEALTISGKSVAITGAGQSTSGTVINPGGTAAVPKIALNIAPGVGKTVSLSDLRVTGGYHAQFSGGISLSSGGTLQMSNTTVTGNTSGFGGGIGVFTNFSADLTADPVLIANNVTVSGNTALTVGGGLYVAGSATLTDSTVDANTAPQGAPALNTPTANAGGGIFVGKVQTFDVPAVTLDHTTVSNNKAYNGAGAAVLTGASLTVRNNSTFTKNAAAHNGGAIHDSGTATVTGSHLTLNTAASEGGGVFAGILTGATDTPVATISGTDITGGSALIGGGIETQAQAVVHVSGGSLATNAAGFGGGLGVIAGGSADVSGGTTITGNSTVAGGQGGGVWNGGTLSLDGVTVTSNTTPGTGGGLYLAGVAHVTGGSFASNSALVGGGIAVNSGGDADVKGGTTLTGNTATAGGNGGGIWAGGTGKLALDTVTLTGNKATQSAANANGQGGGIYTSSTNTVSAANVDLHQNTAYYGGGVMVTGTARLSFAHGSFDRDASTLSGGGLFVAGNATVSDTTVTGTTAGFEGGGAYAGQITTADTPVLALAGTTIDKATATFYGGGLAVENKATAHVTGGSVTGGKAVLAGGVLVNAGATADITGTSITGNSTVTTGNGGNGGGVWNNGTLALDTVTLASNTATPSAANANGQGGGLYTISATPLTGDHVALQGNRAYNGGGAMVAAPGKLVLTHSTSDGDAATADGGAMFVTGTAQVSDSHLAGNTSGFEGAAVYAGQLATTDPATVTLTRTDVTGATGLIGGGLTVEKGATAHVSGGSFTGNTAVFGGGLLVNTGGSSDVTGTDISSNTARTGNGGGVWNNGTLALDTVTLTSNKATVNAQNKNGQGGAIYTSSPTPVTVTGGAFKTNTALVGGGATVTSGAGLTLTDSSFDHDSAGFEGGALYVSGTATATRTMFAGASAGFAGGAITALKTVNTDAPAVTLTDSKLDDSGAPLGGGIVVATGSALHLTGGQVTGSTSTNAGGLYVQEGATADLHGTAITGNKATGGNGAGVYNGGTTTIETSQVSDNTATAASGSTNTGFGGGVFSYSSTAATGVSLTLDRVTVAGNHAVGGAGVEATNATTVRTSTIADNVASGPLGGALLTSGALLLQSSTVHGNSASGNGAVGGLINFGGPEVVAGSVMGSNTPKNCGGAITDGGYNQTDATDASCGFTAAAHDVLAAAKLHSLADNGGPTPTKYPQDDSPVFNRIAPGTTALASDPVGGGDVALCADGAIDQRGGGRPIGPACDIGAVEATVQAPTLSGPDSARFITGQASSLAYTATGVPTPAITESGALPAGVTLTDAGDGTATIAGTPAAGSAGTYHVTVRASNGVDPDATIALTLLVVDPVKVTTASLPDGTIGSAYSAALAATGGVPPYTWAVTAGALPAGLTLAADGTITGTPTGPAGTSTFTVKATDAESGSLTLSDSRELSITVKRTPTVLTADPAVVKLSGLLSLNVTIVNVKAHLSTQGGTPLAGQNIAFKAGTTPLCTATTDATGTASCQNVTVAFSLTTILALGYDASFAGTPYLAPSSAHGALIG